MFSYGMVFMPLSAVGLPLAVWIPPAYAELGIPLATIGTIFLVSRLSDAITDPLIGWASDRTRTRIGRRKPYMLAGLPLFMLSVYMLFLPPAEPGWLYMLGWVSALYLAATIMDLPYLAWGAEISPDYRERSRVAGIREQFHFAGVLTSMSLPLLMKALFAITALTLFLRAIGQLFLVLLPITVLLCVATVPEREPRSLVRPELSRGERWRIIARNRPFGRLMVCYTMNVLASAMAGGLSFLFVKHVMLAEHQYPFVLLLYYLASVVAVPVWRQISDRIGKHRAVIAAILWYSVWASCIPFVPTERFELFVILMCLKGSAVAALHFIPYSMAADAVDIDTLRSGEERTGIYFAVWGMLRKGAGALGGAVAFWTLALVGFSALVDPTLAPEAGGNSELSKLMLRLIYAVLPAAFKLIGMPFMLRYPLTEARQREIRSQIEGES